MNVTKHFHIFCCSRGTRANTEWRVLNVGRLSNRQNISKITKKKHKLGHTIVCKKCPRMFESSTKMEEHASVHDPKNFKCNNCPRSFRQISELNKHTKFKHKDTLPTPDLSCKLCRKKSSSVSNQNTHMILVHTEDELKRFKCTLCKMTFLRNCDLNSHLNHCGKTKN